MRGRFGRKPDRAPTTRVNHRIKAPQVRVVGSEGKQFGVMAIQEALALAEQQEVDLVEVAPDSKPPVCRLLDYGKYKYLQKKNNKAQKQKVSPVKEIKLRPHIGSHDLEVKMERLKGFLKDGYKIKLRVMFRGREFFHQDNGFKLVSSIVEQVDDCGKIDSPARLEGRNIVAVLSPVRGTAARPEKSKEAPGGYSSSGEKAEVV